MDWQNLSNAAAIAEIGKRLKAYRLKKKLTQKDLAERAGISLFTVAQMEKGRPVSITMLLPVLRVLRLLDNLEQLVPEIGISPIELMKLKGKTPQRIKPPKEKL
ncbi:MAG: helix-turn-helix domain-containing protein [Candidatus Symbiothrix sp.]|nr:helix-turn-helix domain-containing protein [Candidatus Symbiothrix sp.]